MKIVGGGAGGQSKGMARFLRAVGAGGSHVDDAVAEDRVDGCDARTASQLRF